MANFYVTQAGAGTRNGSSLANAWSASDFNGSGAAAGGNDTVWFSGTFTTLITAPNGGTSMNARLKYRNTGDAILVGIEGGTRSYIAVLGLKFTQTSSANNYPCLRLGGATGWLIYGNDFDTTYSSAIDGRYNTSNDYCIIRKNRFHEVGRIGLGVTGPVCIVWHGDYTLVEYNRFTMGLDRIRTHGLKNIVRNNYLGYTDVAIYTGYSPFPFHTDGFQAANSTKTLQKLVFENNYDTDNADTVTQSNSHHFLIQNDDGSALEHVIVRGNIVIRPGGVAYDIRDVDKFRLYNNTYIQIYNGSTGNFRNAFYFSLSGTRNSDDHRYTNNTFSNCPKLLDSHGIITDVTRPTNFSSGANHAYNYTGSQGTLPTGASPANLSSTNPQFTNLATDDLTLQSTSPLRNAGAASTLANGSGSSSTTLVVDDSLPFCDGFGIADGDFIQIGNTTPVRIAAIDYTTHTLTLASARTWADNDAVYVYGTKDVGALPYGTSPPAGTVARANNDYTANVSGDVRMVVFVEDGIPSNPVYDAPYSYTSSGGNVEAYAYPRYATAQEPTLLSSGTVRIGFRLTQV